MCRRIVASIPLVGALLFALCLSACDTSAAASSTPAAAPAQITPTPHATDAPQTIGVLVAALGGPAQEFYDTWGAQDGHSFNFHGMTATFKVTLGADGTGHVFEMLIHDGDMWTLEQAKPACTHFLPPDANLARSFTTKHGEREDVYTSAQARASFAPPSPWYSADGSVNIRYQPSPNGGSGIYQCSLSFGV